MLRQLADMLKLEYGKENLIPRASHITRSASAAASARRPPTAPKLGAAQNMQCVGEHDNQDLTAAKRVPRSGCGSDASEVSENTLRITPCSLSPRIISASQTEEKSSAVRVPVRRASSRGRPVSAQREKRPSSVGASPGRRSALDPDPDHRACLKGCVRILCSKPGHRGADCGRVSHRTGFVSSSPFRI